MGCELTKLASSTTTNTSGKESPPPPAATDPRLPLTARQKFTIIASWKAVARAMEPTGVYMFVKYVFFFTLYLQSPSLVSFHPSHHRFLILIRIFISIFK